MKFATLAINAGYKPDEHNGAVIPPIYQTSTFAQKTPGEHYGYEYSRSGNPTRAVLEECLAALCGTKYGLAYASGMAAIGGVMSLLSQGDHAVVGDDLYGGTYRLFEELYRNYGIVFTYVDATDISSLAAAVRTETKMIWIKTPTNPLLKIIDIAATAEVAHRAGALLVVDNTFLTPYFQRPLALGADLEVHSTTKYLGGHSDVVGGAIIVNDAKLYEKLKFFQNAAGGIPGPFDCWLTLRGLKTLALRMEQHQKNAREVAVLLQKHSRVAKVMYPGLDSHPGNGLARRQMSGFGGMVSFWLENDPTAVREFIGRLGLFTLAESLGGCRISRLPPGYYDPCVAADETARRVGYIGRAGPAQRGD